MVGAFLISKKGDKIEETIYLRDNECSINLVHQIKMMCFFCLEKR